MIVLIWALAGLCAPYRSHFLFGSGLDLERMMATERLIEMMRLVITGVLLLGLAWQVSAYPWWLRKWVERLQRNDRGSSMVISMNR